MECPQCGSDELSIVRSTKKGGTVARIRSCGQGHRFNTEEQPVGWKLEDIRIRHSGDKLDGGRFTPDRLRGSVDKAVIRRLTEGELHEVVEDAVAQLRAIAVRAPTMQRQSPPKAAGARNPKVYAYLDDTDIRDAIEIQLHRKGFRVEHVLYVMAIRGRTDIVNRHGFQRSEDFLRWMYSAREDDRGYPALREPDVVRPAVATTRWRPTRPHHTPKIVVKRNDPEDVQFNEQRFRDSIVHALTGRHNRQSTATGVMWWVLHGLEGQERVNSAQLAVGVMNCLRRVDDMAYLRWAVQLKDMPQVGNIHAEARALITHPSDRLEFDFEPAQREFDLTRRLAPPRADQ